MGTLSAKSVQTATDAALDGLIQVVGIVGVSILSMIFAPLSWVIWASLGIDLFVALKEEI